MRVGSAALFVVLALAACGDSGSTEVNASVALTYTLQTVNGQTLPVTLVAFGGTGGQDIIQSGSLVLKADRTWTSTLTAQSSGRGAGATRDCCYSGTWTQSGVTLSLQPGVINSWTSNSATISGNVITYTERGQLFSYRRN